MLLDKLGVSAYLGIDLVIRHTFYGLWFPLVNDDLLPVPNYWLALLYRTLVGPRVLDVLMISPPGPIVKGLRSYAHCTPPGKGRYPKGALTVFVLNLLDEDFTVHFNTPTNSTGMEEFLLAPDDATLLSDYVTLNGVRLQMTDDHTLPRLRGRPVATPPAVVLPTKRMAFYVFPYANASACK